jgi:succinate dehydrogenase/fumarate reductase flavoprotein subunit
VLTIAGAGMAGLCAAARARELGGEPVVLEKGDRPGGSMLLSSGFIWRFRSLEDFRAECPGGDPRLQELVIQRLDDGLAWLESLGAPVLTRATGNPLTVGWRFDTAGLTEALVRAAGGQVREGQALVPGPETRPGEPLVLATGGFQGSAELVARHIEPAAPLRLRANRWSAGDGLHYATGHGAALSAGMDEFYGRNMADVDFREDELVPLAQLYGRWARVYNERGEEFFDREVSWSENDLVQATARQPGARAWYVVDEAALDERVRDRTVREIVAAAPTRIQPDELPFDPPHGAVAAVRVAAAITHTIGGLAIDEGARVTGPDGRPLHGLFAAGADVGGISAGGYASGLAAALVFGRIAAESALS